MPYPFVSDEKLMYSSLITDELCQWATEHYRTRTFFREEQIPTRSGLLYFINSGFVRLESRIKTDLTKASSDENNFVGTIISFLGADHPIDIFKNNYVQFQAIAQADCTEIFWVYWSDLKRWPDLKVTVLQHLQYQHQKQLILRSILGQKKTIDQLWLYLEFLASLYGEVIPEGKKIPFILTHDNLASVLGTTRVTASRLISQLKEDQKICMISEQYFAVRSPSLKCSLSEAITVR